MNAYDAAHPLFCSRCLTLFFVLFWLDSFYLRAFECDKSCNFCIPPAIPLSSHFLSEISVLLSPFPVHRIRLSVVDFNQTELIVKLTLEPPLMASGHRNSPSTADAQRILRNLIATSSSNLYHSRGWRSLLPPGVKPSFAPLPPPPTAAQLCIDSAFGSDGMCAAGDDKLLQRFNGTGTCAGPVCAQHECCVSKPLVSSLMVDSGGLSLLQAMAIAQFAVLAIGGSCYYLRKRRAARARAKLCARLSASCSALCAQLLSPNAVLFVGTEIDTQRPRKLLLFKLI